VRTVYSHAPECCSGYCRRADQQAGFCCSDAGQPDDFWDSLLTGAKIKNFPFPNKAAHFRIHGRTFMGLGSRLSTDGRYSALTTYNRLEAIPFLYQFLFIKKAMADGEKTFSVGCGPVFF